MKLGKYRHFKGTTYEVIGVAKDSETLEDIVVYKNPEGELWVRSKAMFEDTIERDDYKGPRFQYIEN